MNIREIKKLKWQGKNELIKIAENLYVEITKTKKVYKVILKKESKQIKATIDNIDNITLTQAKKIVQNLKVKIADKSFTEAREIIRKELAKKQSKKDKEIIQAKTKEAERYLLKNIIVEYYNTEDKKDKGRIKNYIIPALGDIDVRTMQHTDIINKLLKNIRNLNKNNKKAQTTKNKAETAKELMRLLRNFYKFLFLHYNITNNPASFIDSKVVEKIVGKNVTTHYRAITNLKDLQDLYKKIKSLKTFEETKQYNNVSIYVKALMQFLMLNALRIGTAKKLRWEMIDFKNKVINIPAEITKTKINFRLPLTSRSIKILETLKQYNKKQKGLIFKNRNNKEITEATINKHLKRLSNNKTTSHGFRSSFSTILKERGENYLYIETQLMHTTENKVGQAYTRTDYLQQRRELLERWGNLIDPKNQKNKIKFSNKFFKNESEIY